MFLSPCVPHRQYIRCDPQAPRKTDAKDRHKHMIEITTLGSLKIVINGEEVSESCKKTTKLWKLLNLLIINRKKPLTPSVILEAIWPEDDSENSGKSLHNLIYRLRKLLTYDGSPEYIRFRNNAYQLISGGELIIDAHKMEDYFNEVSGNSLPPDKKIVLLKKAMDLYNGEYILGTFDNDVWSNMAVNQYRRMFIDVTCALAEIYWNTCEYDELIAICNKGSFIEPLEEIFCEYLAKGLRAKGQIVQAINACETYFELLYREMGVKASNSLGSIYRELKQNTILLQHNIDYALHELKEYETHNSALNCNFETFKGIYRYEARKATRLGHSIYIILISINDKRDDLPPAKTLNEAKRCLLECCALTLRKGDVVSEFTQTQLILMLTNAEARDMMDIITRIEKLYTTRNCSGELRIRFDMQAGVSRNGEDENHADNYTDNHADKRGYDAAYYEISAKKKEYTKKL